MTTRFLDALELELQQLEDRYQLDTLFLGGGTPSHLSIDELDRLGRLIRAHFELETAPVDAATEVTAECNPSDLSIDKAQALAGLGVNRISLGVQSMNSGKLATLERDHSATVVQQAVETARQFVGSVSLDLIFAAPNETFENWKHDLEQAIQLNPDHISTYELTFEKGTQFWNRLRRSELVEADQNLRADMYEYAIERLESHGLMQYEVSSFARAGHRCRHNETYWSGDPYFAFGPGASRFIEGRRETNHRGFMQYLKRIEAGESPVAESEELNPDDAALERLIIGLRRIDGVDKADFHRRTGRRIGEMNQALIRELIENELASESEQRIWLTRRGLMVSDWIASRFLETA